MFMVGVKTAAALLGAAVVSTGIFLRDEIRWMMDGGDDILGFLQGLAPQKMTSSCHNCHRLQWQVNRRKSGGDGERAQEGSVSHLFQGWDG